jgi:hypothetical protein
MFDAPHSLDFRSDALGVVAVTHSSAGASLRLLRRKPDQPCRGPGAGDTFCCAIAIPLESIVLLTTIIDVLQRNQLFAL